jgi:hypothetical protein
MIPRAPEEPHTTSPSSFAARASRGPILKWTTADPHILSTVPAKRKTVYVCQIRRCADVVANPPATLGFRTVEVGTSNRLARSSRPLITKLPSELGCVRSEEPARRSARKPRLGWASVWPAAWAGPSAARHWLPTMSFRAGSTTGRRARIVPAHFAPIPTYHSIRTPGRHNSEVGTIGDRSGAVNSPVAGGAMGTDAHLRASSRERICSTARGSIRPLARPNCSAPGASGWDDARS